LRSTRPRGTLQIRKPLDAQIGCRKWANPWSENRANLDFAIFRQALRYMIRNTTLPPRVRATAQLQLSQMHCYTRPTQIRNRCIMGGQGRGVLRAFKMTRVRALC
jgi:ribosomal protein S14